MDEEFDGVTDDLPTDKDDKSISSDLIRGHINTIILRSLADGDKYGYQIINEIEEKSKGQYSLKQPSLYSALKRLEVQGYVTSYWGGTVGGGRRKYFSLTAEGENIANVNRAEWEYSRTIIDSLISDKDYDFNNPAPVSVDMRVLKNSTSRVPLPDDEADDTGFEQQFDDYRGRIAELERRINELEEEKASLISELKASKEREDLVQTQIKERVIEIEQLECRITELEEESAQWKSGISASSEREEMFRNELRERIQEIDSLHLRINVLQDEKTALENEISAGAERENDLRNQIEERARIAEELRVERENELKNELEERNRLLEELRNEYEGAERQKMYEEANKNAELLAKMRERYEQLLAEKDNALEEERIRHEQELAEQEALFHEREQDIIHQNFINLVNNPPQKTVFVEAEPPATPLTEALPIEEPAAEASPERTEDEAQEPIGDYQSVIQKIYENSIRFESAQPVKTEARSIGKIDFSDLEEMARRDGIKIVTTAKSEAEKKPTDNNENLVYRGRALFLSACVLFFALLVEGAIIMGVRESYRIPVAIPCIIWAIAVIVLILTGLAYGNQYGKNSLRRKTDILPHTIVLYVISVIVTLIIALAANPDFHNASRVACFITIPIVSLFGIVIFGTTYYILTKPKKIK